MGYMLLNIGVNCLSSDVWTWSRPCRSLSLHPLVHFTVSKGFWEFRVVMLTSDLYLFRCYFSTTVFNTYASGFSIFNLLKYIGRVSASCFFSEDIGQMSQERKIHKAEGDSVKFVQENNKRFIKRAIQLRFQIFSNNEWKIHKGCLC